MSETPTIGYLGPAGSHSHQAVYKLGEAGLDHAEAVPWPSLGRLMEAVAQGKALYGLLPVENALEGAVVEVMEAIGLGKHELIVLAEITIPVVHCLIAPDKEEDGPDPAVETVISHPQALAQCRENLTARFGESLHYELAASTSDAVRRLKLTGNPTWRAVGTEAAAALYGLTVEATNISDAPDNQTRFWLITGKNTPTDLHLPKGWTDKSLKTSVCVGLKDRPGVLSDVLVLLKEHGVNLTRIESRPSKKRFGDYMFYLDMDCDLTAAKHQNTLADLKKETHYLHLAGPYKILQ